MEKLSEKLESHLHFIWKLWNIKVHIRSKNWLGLCEDSKRKNKTLLGWLWLHKSKIAIQLLLISYLIIWQSVNITPLAIPTNIIKSKVYCTSLQTRRVSQTLFVKFKFAPVTFVPFNCAIRGLPYMTSAKCSGFSTSSPPCRCHKSADFVPFVCFLGTPPVAVTNQLISFQPSAFLGPPPPTHCGRHIWKPPRRRAHNSPTRSSPISSCGSLAHRKLSRARLKKIWVKGDLHCASSNRSWFFFWKWSYGYQLLCTVAAVKTCQTCQNF